MPRHWRAVIFLAALLVTTLSFASFASAHTDNVTVLHLTAVQVEDQFVDVAPTGPQPSLGDQDVSVKTCSATAIRLASAAGCAPSSASSTPQPPSSVWSPHASVATS
jgi:hypothetical protein